MTTVNSAGGDGFDACRIYVATTNQKGRADTVVLKSDSTAKVWRQAKGDPRPGFTADEVVECCGPRTPRGASRRRTC